MEAKRIDWLISQPHLARAQSAGYLVASLSVAKRHKSMFPQQQRPRSSNEGVGGFSECAEASRQHRPPGMPRTRCFPRPARTKILPMALVLVLVMTATRFWKFGSNQHHSEGGAKLAPSLRRNRFVPPPPGGVVLQARQHAAAPPAPPAVDAQVAALRMQGVEQHRLTALPPIAVITAVKNTRCDLMRETSQSLANQTLGLEWVVVNDHGGRLCDGLPLPPHKVIFMPAGVTGLGPSRQVGIDASNTPYFAFLDADDMLSPAALEMAVWILETNPAWSIVTFYTHNFGDRGYQEYVWKSGFGQVQDMYKGNQWASTAVVRRSDALRCGAISRDLLGRAMEDWEYWLQFLDCGLTGYTIASPEFHYRRRSSVGDTQKLWPDLFGKAMASRKAALQEMYHRLADPATIRAPQPVEKFVGNKGAAVQRYPPPLFARPGAMANLRASAPCSVLVLTPYFAVGGAEHFVLTLARQFREESCHVTFATSLFFPPHSEEWRDKFYAITSDVVQVPLFVKAGDLLAIYVHLIGSRKTSHVLVNNHAVGFYLASHLRQVFPHVVFTSYCHVNTGDVGGYPGMVAQRSAHFDALFANNGAVANEMIRFGANPSLVHIAYTGVSIKQGAAPLPSSFDEHKFNILWAARLNPEKRPLVAINVLQVLVFSIPNVHLHYAGAGPLQHELESYVNEQELQDHVTLHGFVADMAPMYQHADVLLLTSDSEGVPYVILEAMANGLPVVATRVGGVAEVVRGDGKIGGYTCAKSDTACLASNIARLHASPSARARIGRASREFVLRAEDSHKLIPHLAKSILATKRRPASAPGQSLRDTLGELLSPILGGESAMTLQSPGNTGVKLPLWLLAALILAALGVCWAAAVHGFMPLSQTGSLGTRFSK